jgi:nitroreductase
MEMGQDFNSTNERHAAGALQGLSKMMSSRHSTRAFLNTPVPRNVLEEALAVAQHAPSNSNLQPWRVKVVTGDALQRLTSALVSTVTSGVAATTVPIPEPYRHYRSSLGHQIYGPEGYDIPRTDPEGKFNAELRNYVFFDAPCAMIICIDRSLAQVDVLSVGMYVQTLCLLLEEQGIATCVEASVAGYPQVRDTSLEFVPAFEFYNFNLQECTS